MLTVAHSEEELAAGKRNREASILPRPALQVHEVTSLTTSSFLLTHRLSLEQIYPSAPTPQVNGKEKPTFSDLLLLPL